MTAIQTARYTARSTWAAEEIARQMRRVGIALTHAEWLLVGDVAYDYGMGGGLATVRTLIHALRKAHGVTGTVCLRNVVYGC